MYGVAAVQGSAAARVKVVVSGNKCVGICAVGILSDIKGL